MIRKSVKRLAEKIMLERQPKRDDDSSQSHRALEDERCQLIECVGELQAHEDQGCDHQIEAEMHVGLKSILLGSVGRNASNTARPVSAGQIPGIAKKESFRRRGSVAFVANPFLSGGLCSTQFLLVHAP